MTNSASWYEEWFNSDYYLKLYSHRNDIEAEACIDIIQRATQFHPGTDEKHRVLDIACGPGRHAIRPGRAGRRQPGARPGWSPQDHGQPTGIHGVGLPAPRHVPCDGGAARAGLTERHDAGAPDPRGTGVVLRAL